MRNSRREAAIRIEQPPEIEIGHECFIIFDPMLGIRRKMSAFTFLKTFEACAKAIQIYHGLEREDAEVIPFPERHQAASLGVQGSTCSNTAI